MKNPYYDITVPVFTKMLTSLSSFLQKGADFSVAQGKGEEDFLDSKLAPDMFSLKMQVQIATDNAKGCVARACGIEIPVFEDTETTVAQLKERIVKTIEFINTVTPEQFANTAEQKITLKYFAPNYFMGHSYVVEYALPNFFFHVTTAYAILRNMGVELGKGDYMGDMPFETQ